MPGISHGPATDGAPVEPAHKGGSAASAHNHLQTDSLGRAVIESLAEAVFVQEPDGRIIAWNPAATRIFGIDALTALSQPHGVALMPGWQAIREDGTPLPPDELPSRRALATGEPQVDVVIGFKRDGEVRWIEGSATPLAEAGHTRPYAVVSTCEDVTQRRSTEDALRAEKAMRDVGERLSRSGTLRLDLETGTATWSSGMLALIDLNEQAGIPRDFVTLGRLLRERIHPDDWDAGAEAFDAWLAAEPEPIEYRVVHGDGSKHLLSVTPVLVEGPAGGRNIIAHFRDVSDWRRAEEGIAHLTAMRDVAETVARVGSVSLDLARHRSTWSPGIYRLFDVPHGTEPDFHTVLESRVHADDRRRLADNYARLAAGEIPEPVNYRVVWRDGSVHVLHQAGTLETDDAGTPVRATGYVQDVTEQVAAAEEMTRVTRLRDLAESVGHTSSARVDLRTGEMLWPPEVYRLMDIDPDTDPDRRFALVVERTHPEDRELISDPIDEITQTGRTRSLDFRVRWRDGSEHILHREGIVEFDAAGRPVAVVGHMEDVTERRHAEAEIRRLNAELARRVEITTEQRDALNRELEAFAYSIAHDVRTPLRAIDGFSANVLEDERGNLSDEGVAALRRVRLAAQRLARLLDDLMGLSHVSRRDLARRAVDFSASVLEVGEELTAENPSRRVDLKVEPGLTASADSAMLRLILRELLGNAWKFTRTHEHARIEVGAVDAGGEQASFVKDDGAGFDMRSAAHLFGAFQRMHASDEFEGSGIGLATVQRLVTRHGGRIWAEAAVDQGATFFFTLPVRDY